MGIRECEKKNRIEAESCPYPGSHVREESEAYRPVTSNCPEDATDRDTLRSLYRDICMNMT